MMIGAIGIYCSMKLWAGLKKSSENQLEWWITFQRVAILHQIYVYVIVCTIIDESADMKSTVMLFVAAGVIHIAHEFYFLAAIMKLKISFSQLRTDLPHNTQNENHDMQVVRLQIDDKPPRYDDVVLTPVTPVQI